MSANDADEYIRREIDWIGVPLQENKPFLGICLGAQMLRAPARRQGVRPSARPGRDRLLPDPADRGRPRVVETWPGMRLSMAPRRLRAAPGAELLAEGDNFAVQAIRIGRAFALQFHPEVTHAMMHRWTTRGHERLELPGARPRHTHFADRAVYDYTAPAWLSVFLEHWIGG